MSYQELPSYLLLLTVKMAAVVLSRLVQASYFTHEFRGAVGVTPFVVIPDVQLHLRAVDHHGAWRVDDARARVGFVID